MTFDGFYQPRPEDPLFERLNQLLNDMSELYDAGRDNDFCCPIIIKSKALRQTFRKIAFEKLQPVFETQNDKLMDAKIQYFKEFHGLELDAQKLSKLIEVTQAFMVRRREILMFEYFEKYFEEMCNLALKAFVDEASLVVTPTSSELSFFEHPAFSEKLLEMSPPEAKEIQDALIKPFEEAIRSRLAWKRPRPPLRSLHNFVEGIVPAYRWYLRELETIKDGGQPQCDEHARAYLTELVKKDSGRQMPNACQALIELDRVPYKLDSLMKLIDPALDDELKIVEVFRRLNLN
jgi:hypothetical protein